MVLSALPQRTALCPPHYETRLESLLGASPFAAIRHLSVGSKDGKLILSGRVPNFYTKQVALALAASLQNLGTVIDEVEVSLPT